LVEESRAAPKGRGRPKLLYTVPEGAADAALDAVLGASEPADSGRLVPRTVPTPNRDPYRELSAMLATAVRDRRSPRAVGADAGLAAALAADPAGERDAVDLIQDEAAALGFDPVRRGRVDRPDLVLQHCPFADVAADDPESICALHLGVAEGIARSRGDVEVLDLVVRDPHRAGCRLRLRRVPSAGARASAGGPP
jgi:predicted ArsR family transcriptional regulator